MAVCTPATLMADRAGANRDDLGTPVPADCVEVVSIAANVVLAIPDSTVQSADPPDASRVALHHRREC